MSDNTGLIERPRIPDKLLKSLKKLTIPIKKINERIKKIKNKNVQNGVYGGIFLSLIALLTTFSPYRSTIAFIVAFILVALLSAIIKFIKKTMSYTLSQRIGIALGFALLFAFCAIVIILIDTQIGNPIYAVIMALLTIDNRLFKDTVGALFTSYKDSGNDMYKEIAELLQMKTAEDRATFGGCLLKYLGVLLVIGLIAMVLIKTSYDPSAMNRNTMSYGALMIVPLLISFFIFSPLVKAEDSSTLMMLAGGFICFMIVIYSYYSTSLTPNTIYYGGYAMNILLLIILIVGLAVIFKVFSGQLKKLSGWPGFFSNLMFFIPCLLSDGMQYLFQQINITPNVVILLLFIEITLILLYLYVPVMIDKLSQTNTALILNRPVFIDKEFPIGDSSLFLMTPTDDTTLGTSVYRKNYTFSMWIYLNAQTQINDRFADGVKIFDFGNGKPKISYKNQSSNTRLMKQDVFEITFTNTKVDASNNAVDTNYEISLPNQKWNNFVFNYFGSKVDLYINGSLERTFNFSKNVPVYLPTDVITVGSPNGLDGAICNVNYYKTPLSSDKIATIYNLLFMKNPPMNL
jgi:hypothetical protein